MQHTAANRKTLHGTQDAPDVYAGYAVRDPHGRKVGVVKETFVNAHGEIEYVRMRIRPFALRTILLPVRTITADRKRRMLTLG
jgi:hypothetical protein